MKHSKHKPVRVPGVSIWPQPKSNPRERYKITYRVKCAAHSGANGTVRKTKGITVTASADLAVTVEMATKISQRRERVRAGLIDREEARYAAEEQKPLIQHLAEYKSNLVAAGCTAKHIRQMYGYAKDLLLGADAAPPANRRTRVKVRLYGVGADFQSDIVASSVREQLGKVKAERSAETANRYLVAVNAFLNWGVSDTRWSKNVCEHLEKYNVEEDRRVRRRAISVADVVKFITNTATLPARGTPGKNGAGKVGPTGYERALIYKFCVTTGLRANECRNILIADLLLDEEVPGVWCQAKRAKNRKRLRIDIPGALADELRVYVSGRAATARVFNVPANTARMLKRDLEAVGIPYKLNDEVFDFHGLRHQCGAILLAAGANPKGVQQHLRHSTIKLTMDTYGHVLDTDRKKLAGLLPTFPQTTDERNNERAGGSQSPQVSSDVPEEVGSEKEKPRSSGEEAVSSEITEVERRGIEPRFAECDSAVTKRHRSENPCNYYTRLTAKSAGAGARRLYREGGRIRFRRPRPINTRQSDEQRTIVSLLISAAPSRKASNPPSSPALKGVEE